MTHRAVFESSRKRRGQTLVEFTFVGIPMMFVLISTFELSRGMWDLRYARPCGETRRSICDGTRANCAKASNSCTVVPGPATNTCVTDNNLTAQGVQTSNPSIAEVIRCAAKGLDPAKTMVTFTSLTETSAPAVWKRPAEALARILQTHGPRRAPAIPAIPLRLRSRPVQFCDSNVFSGVKTRFICSRYPRCPSE